MGPTRVCPTNADAVKAHRCGARCADHATPWPATTTCGCRPSAGTAEHAEQGASCTKEHGTDASDCSQAHSTFSQARRVPVCDAACPLSTFHREMLCSPSPAHRLRDASTAATTRGRQREHGLTNRAAACTDVLRRPHVRRSTALPSHVDGGLQAYQPTGRPAGVPPINSAHHVLQSPIAPLAVAKACPAPGIARKQDDCWSLSRPRSDLHSNAKLRHYIQLLIIPSPRGLFLVSSPAQAMCRGRPPWWFAAISEAGVVLRPPRR